MDDDESKPTFVIMGRDVFKIPCFRNTFLYGIGAYIGFGLTAFLFTSRPTISSHVGMTAFTVVCLGYWTDCRYNYAKNKLAIARIQENLHKAAVMEGSVVDSTGKKKVFKTPKLEDV